MKDALNIHVTGIVQGVGFRPFVYRIARRNLISGWVLNGQDGVHIFAQGEREHLDSFLQDLEWDAPAAARIENIHVEDAPLGDFEGFEIRQSEAAEVEATTLVSPDIATCSACLAELFDPQDHRYHYPFINCTDCGPRFTIIEGLPYDRPATSMACFDMCPSCAEEYGNPEDRRFHAQPDACFECGPALSLWAAGERVELKGESPLEQSDFALAQVADALAKGKVVAIKGLGGYHLACDATNAEAVELLRQRKHRYGKPLAIMVHDVEEARAFCRVGDAEEQVLASAQRPIVLLERQAGETPLASRVADSLHEVGVMLPYTPVQHLVMALVPSPLVMTSGNISEEPILTQNHQAHEALAQVADLFLDNNRDIVSRYDDSVLRVVDSREFMVRRARSFAPAPLGFPTVHKNAPKAGVFTSESANILAAGPEQKATFCITRGGEAFVSQHIGDLESLSVLESWHETRQRYEQLFDLSYQILACDLHPEYLASKWARGEAAQRDLPLVEVQHHHAHIASVLGENGVPLDEQVIGLAFDGTGYGTDGAIWGCEALIASCTEFTRYAHLAYMPMPGGAAAIEHPARMAYGLLSACNLLEHPAATPLLQRLGSAYCQLMDQMIAKGLNTPQTSSLGRLFDAVSALLGLGDDALYDGSGACFLEAALYDSSTGQPVESDGSWNLRLLEGSELNPAPLLEALLDDVQAGASISQISRRFHDAIVAMTLEVCQAARQQTGITTVALSGGCFMNRFLLTQAPVALEEAGFKVLLNKQLPSNDGCISYGQAVVARAQLQS